MDIHAQIWVFAGSLAAIIALAGLAVWLKLGGSPVIAGEDDARRLADEVWDGFAAKRVAIDRAGIAALLEDAAGRIMVIKRHGNRFAGRILTVSAHAAIEGSQLIVSSGETRFGRVTLTLPDAAVWAEAINGLEGRGNA